MTAGQRYHQAMEMYGNTTVSYSTSSNVSISTAFMTSSQFDDLRDGSASIADAISDKNGTDIHATVRVGSGDYYIVMYADAGNANTTLAYTLYPNNPLTYGQLSAPEPSGIASFGLSNVSGADSPYTVNASDVIGLASISSLGAENSSAGVVGANPSGVGLQLNSVLLVNEAGGQSQTYWCQNTPDFVTKTAQLSMGDNIWNFSSSGILSNATITSQGGLGTVSTYQQDGTQYYYNFEADNVTYALPMGLVLLINATVEPGTGVLVQFGAKSAGSGLDDRFTGWFDNVTIHDTAAQSAYFFTSGNATTVGGLFYDTEFVWTGEANGEDTFFTQMNSSLGLFYANGEGSHLTPFPSYFSFGYDTDEAADNLRMSYSGNGTETVSTGNPNYEYLGSAEGAFSLSSIEGTLGFPGVHSVSMTSSSAPPIASTTVYSSTTASATSSQTTISSESTASTSSTSSSSQSSSSTTMESEQNSTSSASSVASGGGVPEFPSALGGAAVTALLVSSYIVTRKRGGGG